MPFLAFSGVLLFEKTVAFMVHGEREGEVSAQPPYACCHSAALWLQKVLSRSDASVQAWPWHDALSHAA